MIVISLVASVLCYCYCACVNLNCFLVVTSVDDSIAKFLSTHDESQLKDICVEEMRRIIPKLFMYCYDHNATSCKKGLAFYSSEI